MISHNKKYIFVHVPKTGGQSVMRTLFNLEHNRMFSNNKCNEVLYGLINEKYRTNAINTTSRKLRMQHTNAKEYKQIFGDDVFNSYYKFAFVRNPWDHLVSTFRWGHKNFPALRSIPFGAFVEDVTLFTKTMRFVNHYAFDCSQYNFLYEDDKCLVDYIGKFESIQKDFNIVCEKISLPTKKLHHVNKSGPKTNYRTFYNDRTKKIVEEKFAKDIEAFGYEF